MKKIILLLMGIILLAHVSRVEAWNYPRDGKFKQLSPRRDPWCFVDERWDITAPDKWQHIMGSYLLQKSLQKRMNKYLAATIIISGSIYKELAEDAYREGWSARDLFCGVLGVVNAIYLPNNMIAIYKWNSSEKYVMIMFGFHFDL